MDAHRYKSIYSMWRHKGAMDADPLSDNATIQWANSKREKGRRPSPLQAAKQCKITQLPTQDTIFSIKSN